MILRIDPFIQGIPIRQGGLPPLPPWDDKEMKPYFETELGRLYNGDCLEILPLFNDESIDFVLTSPPYKNAYEGIGISKGKKTAKYHYFNDVGEPLYVIEDAFEILHQKLKKDGIAFLNLGWNNDSGALRPFYIIERCIKQGWFCPDNIIWHKKNPIPNTAYQLTNSYEYIFLLTKRPFYKIETIERLYKHNVLNIAIDSEDTIHNAAFPKELPLDIIQTFVKKDRILIDPFAGRGTVLSVCESLKIKWIGIEINKKYCDASIKRIKKEIAQLKLPVK